MTLSSLLIGLRGQAALQARKHGVAPSIDRAPTHSKTKAGRSSKQVTDAYGFGCRAYGPPCVRHCLWSSPKLLSIGIVKDSSGTGLGKFVTGGQDVLKFRNKF